MSKVREKGGNRRRAGGLRTGTAQQNKRVIVAANDKDLRRTQAVVVLDELRADIVAARLKPNTRLRFDELKAQYGVGASPLREALSRLTADRLVELDLQRGFRVAPVSIDDLMDILGSRKLLESMALRQAIRDADDAWEGAIVAAHHRLTRIEQRRAADASADLSEEWEARHREFHDALISGCQLSWLLHFCGQLRDQSDRYRHMAGVPDQHFPSLSRDHRALVDACLARDEENADKLLRRHYDEAGSIIRNVLDGHDGDVVALRSSRGAT